MSDDKTYYLVIEPTEGLVELTGDKFYRKLFFDLFPYFKDSGVEIYGYMVNVLLEPDSKVYGASLAVFSPYDSYPDAQFITSAYSVKKPQRLCEMTSIPKYIFKPAETNILSIYDNIKPKKLQDITELWRDKAQH